MKKTVTVAVSLFLLLASMEIWSADNTDPDLVLVTGEHWMAASDKQKFAYLFGIGNMLEIEQAMQINAPTEVIRQHSIVPVLIEGLSNNTLAEIKELLDKWYAAKSDQAKRPVIETLYVEFALPNVSISQN